MFIGLAFCRDVIIIYVKFSFNNVKRGKSRHRIVCCIAGNYGTPSLGWRGRNAEKGRTSSSEEWENVGYAVTLYR